MTVIKKKKKQRQKTQFYSFHTWWIYANTHSDSQTTIYSLSEPCEVTKEKQCLTLNTETC